MNDQHRDAEAGLQEIQSVFEQELREQFELDDDWTVLDTPWMAPHLMSELMQIIGEHNFRYVSGSAVSGETVGRTRATLMVNEEGRANIRAHNETVRT